MSTKKLTQEQVIKNLQQKHPTLNFDKFVYINNRSKSIVVHTDGEEYSLCYKHLMRGIVSNNNYTTESVVKKFKEKFPESECDYSKVVYTGMLNKVSIVCPIHGEFETTPNRYLVVAQYSCPNCGLITRIKNQTHNTKIFVERALLVQPELDYSKVEYVSSKILVELICKEHGSFFKKPNKVFTRSEGCPKCSSANTSKPEKELTEFIRSLGLTVSENNRIIIKPYELDIVIESLKIAIEYNGLYYHSEAFGKGDKFHLHKTELCEKAGYRLIHIYEDEWRDQKDLVKEKLTHMLGRSTNRSYARKLKVISLNKAETNKFLDATHIQGNTSVFSESLGLVDSTGKILACMTFCKNRFSSDGSVELLRFATSIAVVGGFSKLLTHYVRSHPKDEIISYSDKRWSIGDVYSKNGFVKVSTSAPGYYYVGPDGIRQDRQTFMKHKLHKIFSNFDETLTEEENCRRNNYFRIWNCGMDKWKLK